MRSTLLARLTTEPFDVLIIGGGITGAGIARDAVLRGLKVALIEQGDFASGTSSKTSKLIHGGLRYLEQGRLGLVGACVRERHRLRLIAPSLVHPVSLLLPVYAGDPRSAWTIRAGLWLYDLLAGRHAIKPHRFLSSRRALSLEPGLRVDGLRAAGVFSDCLMDDARLCLANVLQAVSLGAVCCNYVQLRTLLKTQSQVCGAMAQDVLSGQAIEIRASAVINAAGPWADQVRRLSVTGAPARLAPTKGIHLVVPRLNSHAIFASAHADGRMLFVLPWGEYTLVGTTETRLGSTLDALHATSAEVDYLLSEANRLLPGAHLEPASVLATFAGARPLLAFGGSSTRASRLRS